jgi:hypothetical protein
VSVRTRLLNLLLAAVLALAVARLATALRSPGPELPGIPEASAPGVAPSAATGAEPEETAAGTRPEGYEVIVARDLFSAARGVIPPAPPAAGKPAAAPPPQPKLTLSGVVIIDGEKTAFLQEGAQEARPRKVREGESFAGGTVKVIRPDGVTFLFAGKEITVPLRMPKEGGAAAVGAALPQPDSTQRRVPQPVFPTNQTGQVRRPQQAVPGAPRVVPPTIEEEPVLDDEEVIMEGEEGTEEFDEEGLMDTGDLNGEEPEE